MVDKGKFVLPSTAILLGRHEIDLSEVISARGDSINSIAVDEVNWKYMVIVTQQGFVYFYNFDRLLLEGVAKIETWTSNTILSKGFSLVSVFNSKKTYVFNVRTQKLVYTISPTVPKREAYSTKNIMFVKRKERMVLMNSGLTNFKILDVLTRKVLRRFAAYSESPNPENKCKATSIVSNFTLNLQFSVVAFLVKDSPHIMFFDLLKMRVFKTVKLYSPEDLPPKMFLLNSVVTSSGQHVCVILQFAFNIEDNSLIKSVLVLLEIVRLDGGGLTVRNVLHHKISSLNLNRKRQ